LRQSCDVNEVRHLDEPVPMRKNPISASRKEMHSPSSSIGNDSKGLCLAGHRPLVFTRGFTAKCVPSPATFSDSQSHLIPKPFKSPKLLLATLPLTLIPFQPRNPSHGHTNPCSMLCGFVSIPCFGSFLISSGVLDPEESDTSSRIASSSSARET
jgi:hypothetical protein